jgi:hypothetical protein
VLAAAPERWAAAPAAGPPHRAAGLPRQPGEGRLPGSCPLKAARRNERGGPCYRAISGVNGADPNPMMERKVAGAYHRLSRCDGGMGGCGSRVGSGGQYAQVARAPPMGARSPRQQHPNSQPLPYSLPTVTRGRPAPDVDHR